MMLADAAARPLPRGRQPVAVASARCGREAGASPQDGLAAPGAAVAACAASAVAVMVAGARARRRRQAAGNSRLPRRAKASLPLPSALHTIVGKRELKGTISWMLDKHGRDRTCELLDNLKAVGFSWATRAGVSIGVGDLVVPKTKPALNGAATHRTQEADKRYENGDITVVEKFLKVTDEWKKASESVKDAAIQNFEENDPSNPVYMMSSSGARGNVSQVRQLIAMRGLMADATGQVIDVPIKNCLTEGMTAADMMISSNGARKGCIDTALGTADSGYLYRRLDFAASSVVVRIHDCGTHEAVDMYLKCHGSKPADLADRIRGRVLAGDVVHPESLEVLYEKGELLTVGDAKLLGNIWKQTQSELPIRVRSSLQCWAKDGVCSTCFGEDMSTPGELVKIGTPIGTIAAQSMGEPGTQLTMRTFHTGGAFEGGAFQGIQARGSGTVRLTDANGDAIVATGEPTGQGEWFRTPFGDIACTLALDAKLSLVSAEGEVLQEESLSPSTRVRVQDGEEVTTGQVLGEIPEAGQKKVDKDDEAKKADLDKLPKPILADEPGELLVTPVPVDPRSCIPQGSQLMWVLRGDIARYSSSSSCELTVRHGDSVVEDAPVALEWTTTSCAGVPRLARMPALDEQGAEPPASIWRQFAWAEKPVEKTVEKADEAFAREETSLRVDFDGLVLDGLVTEYRAAFHLPDALQEQDKEKSDDNRRAMRDHSSVLDKEDVPSATVYAHSEEEEEEEESVGAPGAVTLMCSSPTETSGSAVNLASVKVHPEHVVPHGGLVFYLSDGDGHQTAVWSPEEVHSLDIDSQTFSGLHHGSMVWKDWKLPEPPLWPVMTSRMEGVLGVYRSTGKEPGLVEEPNGVVRRESWDRVRTSSFPGMKKIAFDCTVKPGHVMFVARKLVDDGTWWTEAEDGGVHLHQKLVPPGTPFLPGKPNFKSDKDWWLVELLEDPNAEVVGANPWLLIRPARAMQVPAPGEPHMPHAAKTASFWQTQFKSGQLVNSASPVALAHEAVATLSRNAGEPHCVSVALGPLGAERRRAAAAAQAARSGPMASRLETVRDSARGRLALVQHLPARRLERGSDGERWREAPAKYVDIWQHHGSETWPSSASAAPVPRRTLASPKSGVVLVAKPGKRQTGVVVVGPEDLVRFECRERPSKSVGDLVRSGDMLNEVDASPHAGQIWAVERLDGRWIVEMRQAHVYLVTKDGRVVAERGSLVEKGDLLGTEDLAVPKTADIVQGLPKIAKLFEATGGVLKKRLDVMWQEALKEMRGVEAAKYAALELARQVVFEVQSVYREQGVDINAKHIELVLRQMTSKAEVISGGGLLKPGSMISYVDLEALDALRGHTSFHVRPRILGVTEVGKQLHVLVSMGFREVENILTKDLQFGPTSHSMAGIKENLMVGKSINVGPSLDELRIQEKALLGDSPDGSQRAEPEGEDAFKLAPTRWRRVEGGRPPMHIDLESIPEWGPPVVMR